MVKIGSVVFELNRGRKCAKIVRYSFIWHTGIQDSLNRFSQSFHQMNAFWVQMINLDLFCRYLKGRCHGNRFCAKKMANSPFLSLWDSETVWAIVLRMSALIAALIGLDRVKKGEIRLRSF